MLDVDGVLISGRPSDGKPWTHELKNDLGIDPEVLVEEFFLKDWQLVVNGQQELRLALLNYLKKLGNPVTSDALISYWFEMDSRIMQAVLEDCRTVRSGGTPVYLTTNQEHCRVKYLMEELDLQSEVDGIVYSAQLGASKPDPSFYSGAERFLDKKPGELLLVDDTYQNVEGAIQAGWHAVHWTQDLSLADILQTFGHP